MGVHPLLTDTRFLFIVFELSATWAIVVGVPLTPSIIITMDGGENALHSLVKQEDGVGGLANPHHFSQESGPALDSGGALVVNNEGIKVELDDNLNTVTNSGSHKPGDGTITARSDDADACSDLTDNQNENEEQAPKSFPQKVSMKEN